MRPVCIIAERYGEPDNIEPVWADQATVLQVLADYRAAAFKAHTESGQGESSGSDTILTREGFRAFLVAPGVQPISAAEVDVDPTKPDEKTYVYFPTGILKARLKDAPIERKSHDGIGYWEVSFEYDGVDRPITSSVSCGNNRPLAERLRRAALAGKAVELEAPVLTDHYGQTYAGHNCKVMGRRLNADLKRLGF